MFSLLKEWTALRIVAFVLMLSLAMGVSSSDLRAQEYTMAEIVETGHRFFSNDSLPRGCGFLAHGRSGSLKRMADFFHSFTARKLSPRHAI